MKRYSRLLESFSIQMNCKDNLTRKLIFRLLAKSWASKLRKKNWILLCLLLRMFSKGFAICL